MAVATIVDTDKMLQDYASAWSSHDPESIASFFTEDCIYDDAGLGVTIEGREELKGFTAAIFAAIPDLKIELLSVFLAGKRVGFEWTMSGTHRGDLLDLPATGKRFSVRGVSIAEMEDGRIRSNTDYWSYITLLRYLGLEVEVHQTRATAVTVS